MKKITTTFALIRGFVQSYWRAAIGEPVPRACPATAHLDGLLRDRRRLSPGDRVIVNERLSAPREAVIENVHSFFGQPDLAIVRYTDGLRPTGAFVGEHRLTRIPPPRHTPAPAFSPAPLPASRRRRPTVLNFSPVDGARFPEEQAQSCRHADALIAAAGMALCHDPCYTVQYGDLTECKSCGQRWDTNDQCPPKCPYVD